MNTPVKRAAAAFGSRYKLALAIGTAPSTIYSWEGKGGGAIPTRRLRQVLNAAVEAGVELKPEDLIPD